MATASQTPAQAAPAAARHTPAPERAPADSLVKRLAGITSRRAAYAAGLAYAAQRFNAPYAALTMDVDNHSLEETVAASEPARQSWRRHCDGMMLNVRYRQYSQARFFQAQGRDGTLSILAVPLTTQKEGAIGALALVAACEHRALAAARLSELQTIVAAVELHLQAAGQGGRSGSDAAALSKVAAHENLAEFCFTLTNSLKSNLSCEQVALGLVRRASVQIACVSGFDALYPRSPGTRLIQQAMCECLDAGEIICCQADAQAHGQGGGRHLHQRWHASMGASPVASIPLFADDACVAILSLSNAAGDGFQESHLAKVREIVSPMMPGMLLLERANRSAWQRAGESLWAGARSLMQPGHWRRKVIAAILLAASVWTVCGTTEYRLTAPCVVEATGDVQLSAPCEAAIARMHVKPGDRVVAGQPLVSLDSRPLATERNKAAAELREAEVRMLRALQSDNVSLAAQARAEAATFQARIDLLDGKLATAIIRAPGRGVILDGQSEDRTGAIVALGEPLLRFAPEGQWKVVVHVPDRSAEDLAVGQDVVAAMAARPEQAWRMKVAQLQATASLEGGQNVFAAEAEFTEAPPAWLRGGMQGVARIQMGLRPVWWVWAHRTIDSMRLHFWKI